MRRALEGPLRQLAENAGLDGSVVVSEVRRAKRGFGLNAETNEIVDMVAAGIVDPAKVTRSALESGALIARNILTTEPVAAGGDGLIDEPEVRSVELGDASDPTDPRVSAAHGPWAAEDLLGDLQSDEDAGTTGESVDPIIAAQERRNAEARAAFLNRYDTVTLAQLLSGAAKRPSAREMTSPTQWHANGEIFATEVGGTLHFPTFQLRAGVPIPAVRAATSHFRAGGATGWEIALWFGGQDPWLRATPAEVLRDDPDLVVSAARRVFDTPT